MFFLRALALPSDLVQVLELPQNYSFVEVHAALSDPRNILKNDYLYQYLNKATNPDVPATYNDKVKFLLAGLYMKGLGAKGDELDHVSNIAKILANGFNQEDLPELYIKVIQEANDEEINVIFISLQKLITHLKIPAQLLLALIALAQQ